MAEVVWLDIERARRIPPAPTQRVQVPALLWLVGGRGLGHRRVRGLGAACGADGPLVLADPGARPCPLCYPPDYP